MTLDQKPFVCRCLTGSAVGSPVGSGYAQIHDLNLNAFTQREGGSQLTLHRGVQAGSLRFRVRQAKLKWNPRSAPWLDTQQGFNPNVFGFLISIKLKISNLMKNGTFIMSYL